jgi:hypothetical protein
MRHVTLGSKFSKHEVVSMVCEQLAPWASLLIDFVVLLVDARVARAICSKCVVLDVFKGCWISLVLCALCPSTRYDACGLVLVDHTL